MVDIEDWQLLVHNALNRRVEFQSFLLIGSLPCFRNQCINFFIFEPGAIDFIRRRTGQNLPGEPAIWIPAVAASGGFGMKIPVTPLLVQDGCFIEVHGDFEADLTPHVLDQLSSLLQV